MTTHDEVELVERVARAIVEATGGPWELISCAGQQAARHEAKAAISEISAVLEEPNEAMLEAVNSLPSAYGNVWRWKTMLAASPLGGNP
ncbi:hypothetical protein [Phyllobacterium leguminum]|uniref:Uncharacterized protein n=1 Tax=Phyllobacterium leguminum TaxID=314237 RepID=A0A318T5R8_9HYPH|nr:hypothetical protein [Phyllobacterium leguminum]PYE89655.1 hypothetical protein C7477_103163 [Phyllobacterium leguminum]